MQHPDEGTLHAWLDGALGDAEAARIAAHVEVCAECAERTREARGLIAGASRIVSATDWGVGAGMGDAEVARSLAASRAHRRRRWFTPLRAAAAAVLFVAAGTLLVARDAERGTLPRTTPVAAQRQPALQQTAAPLAPASRPPANVRAAPAPRPRNTRRTPAVGATQGVVEPSPAVASRVAPPTAAPSLDSASTAKKARVDAVASSMALHEVVVTGMRAERPAAAAGANAFAPTTDAPRCYDISDDSTAERIGPRMVLLSGGRVNISKVTDSVMPMAWRAKEPGMTEVLVGQPTVSSLLISEHGGNVSAILREGSRERPISLRRCP